MTTAYTSLLGLALPVTGELSGVWGDTVNNSITSLLDSAIAGTTTLSSDADVTLTTTTGASNTSRQAILLWTAGGTVTRNITAPAQSKIYTVINASSSTQSIVLRGAGPTTGVTIVKGESAVCAWNGSDFIKISNTSGAGVFTTVTASSLTSGRVTYATTAGLLTDSANLLYSGTDLTVYALTVGRGGGAVGSNTAVGTSALAANTSGAELTALGNNALQKNTTANWNIAVGSYALRETTTGSSNTAIGYSALQLTTTASSNTAVGYQTGYSNTTGANNTFLGWSSGYFNTTGSSNVVVGSGAYAQSGISATGSFNVAIGQSALQSNTSASNNTAVGYQAGYLNSTGTNNVFLGGVAGYNSNGSSNLHVGYGAGFSSTGSNNTFVGAFGTGSTACGGSMTTGSKNTIIGAFSGNQGGLDMRTINNVVVLSDGDGTLILNAQKDASIALQGAITKAGIGITFPATQSASSDANTLDDYEEGTWTPGWSVSGGTISALGGSTYTPAGTYTKIGNTVYIRGYISYASETGSPSGALAISGLPFTPGTGFGQSQTFAGGITVLAAGLWLSNPPTYAQVIPGSTTTNSIGYRTSTGGSATTYADMNRATNYSQFVFQGQYTV